MCSAASRSAVPIASVTAVSTINPCRFSVSRCARYPNLTAQFRDRFNRVDREPGPKVLIREQVMDDMRDDSTRHGCTSARGRPQHSDQPLSLVDTRPIHRSGCTAPSGVRV
jgi:hypothetical protein